MPSELKRALIGTLLPTQQLAGKRLNNIRALVAFFSTAFLHCIHLQETYLGLLTTGSAALGLAWLIGWAINQTRRPG